MNYQKWTLPEHMFFVTATKWIAGTEMDPMLNESLYTVPVTMIQLIHNIINCYCYYDCY